MIRFLQTDNRLTKALLVVIIGAASISMVVYLIPGLTGAGASSPDTYAIIYPIGTAVFWRPVTLSARRASSRWPNGSCGNAAPVRQ